MGTIQSRLQATPLQKPAPPTVSLPAGNALPVASRSPTASSPPKLLSKTLCCYQVAHPAVDHLRFFDLPPEIRNMIYEQLVVVGKVFYSPNDYDIWNGLQARGYKLFRKPELQILRVCKQMHAEAESLYLSKNLFVLPIEWQRCHPFIDVRHPWYSVERKPISERYVFSSAGLLHVKNVSVAVDQRLSKFWAQDHDQWKRDELLHHSYPVSQQTTEERYKNIHDSHLDMVYHSRADMLRCLGVFSGGLIYVEVDYTNAYCGIGDCRPIDDAVTYWISEVKPKNIDMIGLQTMEEKQEVMHCAYIDGISHRELRQEYGLRFRELGENKAWDKWRMEGELENESAHYATASHRL